MTNQKFVDWDGLVYYDGKIKTYVEDNMAECLKFGGIVPFSALPDPCYQNVNYVFTVKDSFTTNEHFIEPGIEYLGSTTVQVTDFDGVFLYSIFREDEVDLAPIMNEIEKLQKQTTDADVILTDLQSSIESQEERVDEIDTLTKSMSSEVESLSESFEDLDGTVNALNDNVTRNDERIDKLSDSLVVVNNNLTTVSSNVNNIQAEVATKAEQSSLKGLATETYVQVKIAEAQLNQDGNVDMSVYVTQEDLKEVKESITYGEF